MHHHSVIDFWFNELSPNQWWAKDETLDKEISARFTALHKAATACELWQWRTSATGRLAEIILLDQFSRNIYRNHRNAFASDALALTLAQEAIAANANQALTPEKRSFLYMPFMHSESALIHEQALSLFSEPGLENNLEFERQHKAIIDKFSRYPHRNAILGRQSTDEELTFLQQPNSSF